MSKSGGGFGYVLAILVLAILLLLSVRAWRNAAPAAAQALKPGAPATVPDHGQAGAGKEVRSGGLPNIKKMGESTGAHADQINEAAKSQD